MRKLCLIIVIAAMCLAAVAPAVRATIIDRYFVDGIHFMVVDLLWWLRAGDTRMYDWPWDDDGDDYNGWEVVA